MSLMDLGKGSKFVIFAALACTLLVGLHLSSLSPLAQFQQWRLPTVTPGPHDQDSHQKGQSQGQGNAVQDEVYSHGSPFVTPTDATPITHATQAPASTATGESGSSVLPCSSIPGGEDVLVVMRTGATEIKDKLPAHLNTTFNCYPHHIIFSDYAETFLGFEVLDVLKDIPEDIKDNNGDFKHYRHIQEVGRMGLDEAELSGEVSEDSGPTGKDENAGWKLDKWKFLPMINQTFDMYPDKKWYVFVESDTYLVWSSLLHWIQHIDSSKSYYFGSEVMIGDDVFAHGGSAFLISRPALEKGVDMYNSKPDYWHEYTAGHWAGDGVLGVALKEADVNLIWSHPMVQGGNPSIQMDWEAFKGDKTLWCAPAVSYHHLIPSEVRDMWHFEQRFLRSVQDRSEKWGKDMSSVIHHGDTFKSFVLPNITSERSAWNNGADEEVPDTADAKMEDCRGLCEMKEGCRQYALGSSGCLLGSQPLVGRHHEGFSSGWMGERIRAWIGERGHCEGRDGWVVP